jgi:hypothetical protein
MEKEMEIVIPEGYEIDKEKSSFEKIVFKKKEFEKWRNNPTNKLNGYYIDNNSRIVFTIGTYNNSYNYNAFATIEQARSALAMARISQIMRNDKRFGGVVTNEEWKNSTLKYCIKNYSGDISKTNYSATYHFLAFHTEEQRELFLQENEDLIKEYLMIE